jgi:DNA-binding NarL/FixJ family response regulator
MNRCIAVVSDLIFATRITGTARKAGATCEIVRDENALQETLGSVDPRVVIVDMNCDGVSAEGAIRTAKSVCPDARVVAYYSHVQTELKEQAQAAGADDVWPRSLFVQQLPGLFTAMSGPSKQ